MNAKPDPRTSTYMGSVWETHTRTLLETHSRSQTSYNNTQSNTSTKYDHELALSRASSYSTHSHKTKHAGLQSLQQVHHTLDYRAFSRSTTRWTTEPSAGPASSFPHSIPWSFKVFVLLFSWCIECSWVLLAFRENILLVGLCMCQFLPWPRDDCLRAPTA